MVNLLWGLLFSPRLFPLYVGDRSKRKRRQSKIKKQKGGRWASGALLSGPSTSFHGVWNSCLIFLKNGSYTGSRNKVNENKNSLFSLSPVITHWQQVQVIWDEADSVCQDWIFLFRKEKDQGTVVAPNPWCLSSSTGAIMNKWQS